MTSRISNHALHSIILGYIFICICIVCYIDTSLAVIIYFSLSVTIYWLWPLCLTANCEIYDIHTDMQQSFARIITHKQQKSSLTPQYAMQSLTDTDRNYRFVLNTFHKGILQSSPSLKSAKNFSYHIFCITSTLDIYTYCSNAWHMKTCYWK